MKSHNSLSIKYYLPIIYVLASVVIGIFIYFFSENKFLDSIKKHEIHHFSQEMKMFQERVNYLLSIDEKKFEREMKEINSLGHVKSIRIFSPYDTVIASSHDAKKDNNSEIVLSKNDATIYDEVKKAKKSKLIYDDKTSEISAFYPIIFPSLIATDNKKSGMLIVIKDINSYLKKSREDNLIFILKLLGIYALVTLTICFIIYFKYVKRVKKIIEGIDKFKDGDMKHTIEITGHDEINELADHINNFTNALHVQNIALNEKVAFLNDYKRVVDESSIVSIGDKQGKITYVNNAFEKISGYTKEELIGNPHSMIRHPDVEKTIFKEMWQTIKSGKVWKGTVKNRAKNGNSYWVDAVVMPIMDHENNIIEYISVRHDISDKIKLLNDIEATQKEIIYTVGAVSETRSKETGEHVIRVAEYSKILALHYGLGEDEAEILKSISPMHDIGKVGISDSILKKAGKLSEEEFETMKSHSNIGYEILRYSNQKLLKLASIVANEHHENWDGSGYPRGLSDENIHIYGRITALADVFDALGSSRVYKHAWEDEDIFQFIKEQKGKKFDPKLVDIFFEHFEEFDRIRKMYQ